MDWLILFNGNKYKEDGTTWGFSLFPNTIIEFTFTFNIAKNKEVFK